MNRDVKQREAVGTAWCNGQNRVVCTAAQCVLRESSSAGHSHWDAATRCGHSSAREKSTPRRTRRTGVAESVNIWLFETREQRVESLVVALQRSNLPRSPPLRNGAVPGLLTRPHDAGARLAAHAVV